jgi:hypothetical protein
MHKAQQAITLAFWVRWGYVYHCRGVRRPIRSVKGWKGIGTHVRGIHPPGVASPVASKEFDMNPKFFTVEEANALIGFLENTLERIRRNRQRYLWLLEEIAILKLIVECGALEANRDSVELEEKMQELKAVEAEIEKARATVRDTGCILKDEERGMVDFFSIQNNTVVYLSWKKGEDNVKFWRSIRDADSNVRRPLEGSPST